MTIDNKFEIGEIVFLQTDPEQSERIVIEIIISSGNQLSYNLSLSNSTSWHYDFEISTCKDVLKALN